MEVKVKVRPLADERWQIGLNSEHFYESQKQLKLAISSLHAANR